jgi:Zn-finger nucleic acid-binding protein
MPNGKYFCVDWKVVSWALAIVFACGGGWWKLGALETAIQEHRHDSTMAFNAMKEETAKAIDELKQSHEEFLEKEKAALQHRLLEQEVRHHHPRDHRTAPGGVGPEEALGHTHD